jgi:hypothetical protein
MLKSIGLADSGQVEFFVHIKKFQLTFDQALELDLK